MNKNILSYTIIITVLISVLFSILVLFNDNNDNEQPVNVIITNEDGVTYNLNKQQSRVLELAENWSIVNNRVYINDQRVYLSASPHTIEYSQWVYFNLTSKNYNGDINAIWGFDTDSLKPLAIERFNPHNVTRTKQLFLVTDLGASNESCDLGYDGNRYKRLIQHHYIVNYINGSGDVWTPITETLCFNSFNQVGNNYTINYNDWVLYTPWDIEYDIKNVEFDDLNKWYVTENLSIQANKNYQVRIWLSKNIFDKRYRKYGFAIKPATKSIIQAVQDEQFYYLDPWTIALNEDIKHYWKLDDGNGTAIAVDSVGNANANKRPNSPTAVNGIINYGYLQTANNENLNYSNTYTDINRNFTVNLWTKYTTGSSYVEFFSSGAGSGTGGWSWTTGNTGVNLILTKPGVAEQGCGVGIGGGTEIRDGNWHMISLVVYANNSEVVYFDGVRNCTGSLTQSFDSSTNYGWIGAGSDTWTSATDEVGFWTRTLSEDEITQLYNSGAGITYSANTPPNVTLLLPINNTNTSNNFYTFNCSATDDRSVKNLSLYFDGVRRNTVFNTTYPQNLSLNHQITGIGFGVHNWTCRAWDEYNEVGTTELRNINITAQAPTVTSISPSDNVDYNISSVTFNCTGVDEASILNLSLFIDGVRNYTIYNTTPNQLYLGLDTTVNNINEGGHNWTCQGYDDLSLDGMSVYRNFNVDLTNPIVYSNGLSDVLTYSLPTSISWGINASDSLAGLDKCWFNYTDNTTISYVNCNTPITSSLLTGGQKDFIYCANDSAGNINCNSTSINVTAIIVNFTTNKGNVTEGDLVNFNIFINMSPTTMPQTNVLLTINNTNYYRQAEEQGTWTNITIPIVIPQGWGNITGIKQNYSFEYEINGFANQTTANKSIKVFNIEVGSCDNYTNVLYNLSIVDEELQRIATFNGTNLNSTLESAVQLYNYDRSILLFNYSNKTSENPFQICFSKGIPQDSRFLVDSIFRYTMQEHAIENYNIVNSSITNTTGKQTIILYTLNNSQNTDFQLTFTGSNFLPLEAALISVNRQYVAENTFKTVELPKTDSNGQTVLHLVRNDVVYNVIVRKDGQILGTFNNIAAFCQDFTIGNCQINLDAFDTGETSYQYNDYLGLNFQNPTYNNVTRIVRFEFSTYDGTIKNVTMIVKRENILGNTTLCANELLSSSGTLQCTIPAGITDSIMYIHILSNGEAVLIDTLNLETDSFGREGNVIAFIYLLAIILIFNKGKNMQLFGTVLGVIVSVSLGLINGLIIGIGSSVIWLIVVIVLMLFKLNKDKPN